MKTFTFPAWCSFGKGHNGETLVDVDLTNQEAKLLKKFGTNSDVYYDGFENCEELTEIYQKVYSEAVIQMTDELRDFGDRLEEEYANDPNWKVDDLYQCGVEFPEEFEDILDDEN